MAARSLRRVPARAPSPALLLPLLILVGCAVGNGDARRQRATSRPPYQRSPPRPRAAPSPSPSPMTRARRSRSPAEPQKIVSLTPATTETLFAIGAGDRGRRQGRGHRELPAGGGVDPRRGDLHGRRGREDRRPRRRPRDLRRQRASTQGPAVEQLRRANIPVLVVLRRPTSTAASTASSSSARRSASADAADGARGLDARPVRRDLAAVDRDRRRSRSVFYEIDVTVAIFTPTADSIYGEMFQLAGGDPITTGRRRTTRSRSRSSSRPTPR